MPFVVETGEGVAGANSYPTLEQFLTYCEERYGETDFDDAAAQAALMRGTLYIDATYRRMFPSVRTNGRAQGLEWPRKAVIDDHGAQLAADIVPQEVIDATCEAARRELAEPGSLLADVNPADIVAEETVGPISVSYHRTNLTPSMISRIRLPVIDAIIEPMLLRTPSNVAFLKRM